MARWYVALAALVGISGCYSGFQALEERDGGVDAPASDAGREPDPSCASGIEWMDDAPVLVATGPWFFVSVAGGERFWTAYPGDAAPGCPASGRCWRVAPIETSGSAGAPRIVSWSWDAGRVEIQIDPERRPFFVSLGVQQLQWASAPPAEGEWPREGGVEIVGDDRFLATATLSNDGRRIFAVTQRRAAGGFYDELRVLELERATGDVIMDHDLASAVPGGLFRGVDLVVTPTGRVWVGYRREVDELGSVGLVSLDGLASQHGACDVVDYELAALGDDVVIAQACENFAVALETREAGAVIVPGNATPERPGLAVHDGRIAIAWSQPPTVVAIYDGDLREIARAEPPGSAGGTLDVATSVAAADDGTFLLTRFGLDAPTGLQRFRACD